MSRKKIVVDKDGKMKKVAVKPEAKAGKPNSKKKESEKKEETDGGKN